MQARKILPLISHWRKRERYLIPSVGKAGGGQLGGQVGSI